jgi:phosphonate transport system ATP-binding protein
MVRTTIGARMLTLERLAKRYGDTEAVTNISLQVPDGQMVGIIGPSGAGKSTTLRMINRLIEPTRGKIICDGADVAALRGQALRTWRTRCAMVFQQFNLIGRLDVLTNVLVGRVSHSPLLPTLCKQFGQADRERALRALARVGLAEKFSSRADQLSGGQQQRVAIARALVQEPRIVLADEPIAALDPRNAARVMESLRSLAREDGMTVMVNLHSVEMARHFCDRIVAMSHGRIVFDGAPSELGESQVQNIYGIEHDEVSERQPLPARRDLQSAVALV